MPIYMKIEGVDGDATSKGHEKWIEVLSFSWGLSNSSASFASGRGAGAGKVSMQDFHFVHRVDKASPKLLTATCTGRHIPSVSLSVTQGDVGTPGILARENGPTDYLIIKLSDILVSGLQPGVNAATDEQPLESVSLNFSKVDVQYLSFDGEVVRGSAGR
jgi:type VI secretion system secreted protein Hcp